MKKYTGYSVEDLLHDQEFVSSVRAISTTEECEEFLLAHGESRKNILRAIKIIQVFKTNEGKLSDKKRYKLWENISRFNVKVSRDNKLVRIKTFAKVAASILIIISLGSLSYLYFNEPENHYQFSESKIDSEADIPMLVLSNGSRINLALSESKIAVIKGQNGIQINNDTIVENRSPIEKTTNEIRLNEVIIPFGKKSKLILEDGTKVWLNAGSHFAFPQKFEGKKREVYLEGEAYFEVAKIDEQPFIISTDEIKIEVLGTKFNVSAYNTDRFNETVLLEGSVAIREKDRLFGERVLMVPNQRATYSKTEKNIVLESEPEPERHIAWIEGWYEFSNESLVQILKKLERYYNINFEYDQTKISKVLPVSGKLDLKDSLNEVMVVLSKVAKFEYQISENSVLIK